MPNFPGLSQQIPPLHHGMEFPAYFFIKDFSLLHFHLSDLNRGLDVGLIGDICHNRFRVRAESILKRLH
jgi:hypothetical protein